MRKTKQRVSRDNERETPDFKKNNRQEEWKNEWKKWMREREREIWN